jgi:hypothetical protein
MIFVFLLAFLAVLWFLDEILTVMEVKRHGVRRERNPLIRGFIKQGGYVFFYFKVLAFAVFCALALLAYSINVTSFYILVTIAIIIYGIIDFRNLDVLRR